MHICMKPLRNDNDSAEQSQEQYLVIFAVKHLAEVYTRDEWTGQRNDRVHNGDMFKNEARACPHKNIGNIYVRWAKALDVPNQIRVASNNNKTKPRHTVASPAGQQRIIKPEGDVAKQMHISIYTFN